MVVLICLCFQAFDAIEDAVRVVDYEIDKIKEKIKRECENMQDSQEYIKVHFGTKKEVKEQNISSFRLRRFLNSMKKLALR